MNQNKREYNAGLEHLSRNDDYYKSSIIVYEQLSEKKVLKK